jgi:hypothetical protein
LAFATEALENPRQPPPSGARKETSMADRIFLWIFLIAACAFWGAVAVVVDGHILGLM